ncbi:MAG: HWE histidine kinase domain-containing protein [Paracoccaceae bacterium]|nr:HWE histidine kinase domain-containing protein [Paracoccaceae bacterium]
MPSNTDRSPAPREAGALDLSSCDREPIHRPDRIQSFACLLAFSTDWLVTRASANVAEVLRRESKDVIGMRAVDLLDEDMVHEIRGQAQLLSTPDTVNRIFGQPLKPDDALFDISLHLSGEEFVVEFEPASDRPRSNDINLVQSMTARLRGRDTVEALATEAALCLRAMTRFDRVMVYRFNEDGSGNVIAESRKPSLESYQGLRFPATDIPKQARALYLRSPLRLISDAGDPTVPIEPSRDGHGGALDLSLSVSRAVSPIHIEYLKNMGVGASMSASIIRDGKLWGLFACHSVEPRHVDFRLRTAIELFVQLASYELAQIESIAERDQRAAAEDLHKRLTSIAAGGPLVDRLDEISEEIARAVAFDGIAVWSDGHYLARGAAPDAEEFQRLTRLLNTADAGHAYVTNSLVSVFPEAADFGERIAGVIALPITRSPRDYLVLFRREIVKTVQWAGDPTKPATKADGGSRLSPRRSFAIWKEIVKGTSVPWTKGEIQAAETVRITLLEIILKISDAANVERKRLTERQEILIAELNHRVRNILGLIRSLLHQSQSGDEADAFKRLSARITAVARAHDQLTADAGGPASLSDLIFVEVAAFLGDQGDRVTIEGPNVALTPEAFSTVALVMHELMTNAAKYGAMSDSSGRLSIALDIDDSGALRVVWREGGGPPVKEPTRKGFGTTIIERTIPYELGGSAEVRFAPSGVEAEFTLPPAHFDVIEARQRPTPRAVAEPESGDVRLSGNILLVEDNAIIAMDTADTLLDVGAYRVETAATVRAALDTLEADGIDAALLDVNLGRETSRAIAETLLANGIPFAFATGYAEEPFSGESFKGVPVLRKPYTLPALLSTIDALLKSR